VAEVPIPSSTIDGISMVFDGVVTTIVSGSQGSVASATDWSFPTSAQDGGSYGSMYYTWDHHTSAFASGGGFTHPGAIERNIDFRGQGYYGFSFSDLVQGAAINGISVVVTGYRTNTSSLPLTITISPYRSALGNYRTPGTSNTPFGTKSLSFISTSSASPDSITVGGSMDTWLATTDKRPWASDDFSSLYVVLRSEGSVSDIMPVYVDAIAVKVHYNTSIGDSSVQYDSIVYTYGDEVIQTGKNGPPPDSSTGAMFQGQLVLNDRNDPSIVRYSYPENPDAFPPSYYLNFETKESDSVKAIRVVNNRLVVGLGSSLWRVAYLPSEKDATFDRGRAVEAISRDYGVVNPMCACTFSPDGPSEYLAFVSNQGIHYTDGYSFTTLTDGVNWRTISGAGWDWDFGNNWGSGETYTPICLINDKENQLLRFYFRNDALGEESYMCLPLSYGSGHWANGQGKIGGLLHMRNYHAATSAFAPLNSAWPVERSDKTMNFYFGYGAQSNSATTGAGFATGAGGGKIYREDGTNIPSKDATMQFTTRRMYLAGLSKEWKLNEVYGYAGSYSGSPVVTYTAKNTKTNSTGEVTLGAKSITLAGQQLHKVNFKQMNEGLRLVCQVSASAYRQESLVLDGENFGVEDSGR
jgi:hypothetical protein